MHASRGHVARPEMEDCLHAQPLHRVRGFDIGGVAGDVAGFFKGAGEAAVESVEGVANAVTNPIDTARGISKLVTDPMNAWPAVWHGITNPIVKDWKAGNEGEAIGRVAFGLVEVLVGAKGLTKVGKPGRGDDAVPDAPRPHVRSRPDGDAPKPDGDAPRPDPDAPAPRAVDRANAALKDLPRAYRQKELNHAAKHADDFGVEMRTDPKLVSDKNPSGIVTPNNAERAAFQEAIDAHVASPSTIAIEGTYRRGPVSYFVDPGTRKVAFFAPDGTFRGGWQLNESQLKSLLDRGYIQ